MNIVFSAEQRARRLYRPPVQHPARFCLYVRHRVHADQHAEKTGDIESKAEVLITIRWADEHRTTWMPWWKIQRWLVWYHNRDSGLMHLDRDDRGVFADQINVNGVKMQNPINQETVTVRATQPGEYVVNLLHYKSNYSVPLPVTVKVEKLNPNVSLVYYDTVELTGSGDEKTAVRFTLDENGAVTNTNQRPKQLLTLAASKS